MNEKIKKQILLKLDFLYGEDESATLWAELVSILDSFRKDNPEIAASRPSDFFSKLSSILITYGDQIHNSGEKPLRTLGAFFHKHLNDIIPAIHILPFYPYSSDDGFSVIDYYAVDKNLGMWEDIVHQPSTFRGVPHREEVRRHRPDADSDDHAAGQPARDPASEKPRTDSSRPRRPGNVEGGQELQELERGVETQGRR